MFPPIRARVTKLFEFEAAHQLPDHIRPDGSPGKCSRPHGHSYKLEVTLYGPVLTDPPTDRGFVIDFYNLGVIVKREIVDRLDHFDLTKKLPFRTTAELMAYYFLGVLLEAGLPIEKVRLWETRTGSAEVHVDDFNLPIFEALRRGQGDYSV